MGRTADRDGKAGGREGKIGSKGRLRRLHRLLRRVRPVTVPARARLRGQPSSSSEFTRREQMRLMLRPVAASGDPLAAFFADYA